MDSKKKAESISGALRRGLRILALLQHHYPASLAIKDIVIQTALPRPTVYRLLEALVDEGCVQRKPNSGCFQFLRIGPDTPFKSLRNKNLNIVISRMQKVAQVTGDSVYLVIPKGMDSMCIHREFGNYPIQVNSLAVGQSQPLGVGSGGLSILAASRNAYLEQTLQANEVRFNLYNGLSSPILRQLVQNARARGYAIIGNYAIPGVAGVGMPVMENGAPIAGLSVCSTTDRMSLSHQRLIAKCLRETLSDLK